MGEHAVVCTAHDAVSHRLPLGRKRVQKRGRGPAFEDVCQLPREVKRVGDTGVAAQAVNRRVAVHSIPDAENAPLLVAVGGLLADGPPECGQDLQVHSVVPDQLVKPLSYDIVRLVDGVEALARWVHRHHELVPRPHHPKVPHRRPLRCSRVQDPVEAARPMGEVLGQIALDVHVEGVAVGDPRDGDAQVGDDLAVGPVSADEVLRADRVSVAAVTLSQPDFDSVCLLGEAGQLGVESELGAEPCGFLDEDGLHEALGQVRHLAGAGGLVVSLL